MQDALDAVEDVREYDVPYHMRFAIDTDVRCGHWYTVRVTVGSQILSLHAIRTLALARAQVCTPIQIRSGICWQCSVPAAWWVYKGRQACSWSMMMLIMLFLTSPVPGQRLHLCPLRLQILLAPLTFLQDVTHDTITAL